MNFKKKISQLIIPRLDGNRLLEDDYFSRIISLVDAGIGGFILFGGRIPETTNAIKRLQEMARTPLLITSDIERGLGQQLLGGTRFLSQWAVAEAIDRNNPDDVALLHDMLSSVREECVAAGIHAVFSPVADVNINPDNPIICTRSFGEEPEKVSWFVKEYVRGLQNLTGDSPDSTPPVAPPLIRGGLRGGVRKYGTVPLFACAKHFPGHGDTAVDSHTSLPAINADRERLEMVELPPFRTAINAGVAMIMIGHLRVPALEPEPIPATFSKRIVTDLLRGKMGFSGLVVTDAIDMGALKAICNEGESAVRCLEAGCDILLHPSEPLKVLEAVVQAVERGRLSSERVEEAYERVVAVKRRESGAGSQESKKSLISSQRLTPNSQLAHKIALKAIKFRKGRGLTSPDGLVCMVIDDDGDGSVALPFLDALKERFSKYKSVSSPSDIEEDETVVIPIFSKVSAWKGNSGLSKESSNKLKTVLEKAGRAIVISFGSPYMLNSFDADVMIEAFDPADFMQRAVVERLAKE